MPVTFANPALLAGAAAAAVPILIHLLSRRRVRRTPFSDLRFLEAVQAQQARSLNLRRWLLLMLRVLIIICLVLGVAQPRVSGLAALPEGARAVIFILDASASMQTQHQEGTRFTIAKETCAEMIGSLPAGSEVQVLVAGPAAEPLFAAWLPARGPVAETLGGISPTDGSFDLASALRAAAAWIPSAKSAPVQIVLLSDLQQAGAVARRLREAVTQLQAAGSVQFLVSQVGEPVANGGVRNVRLPQRAVRAGESLQITAEVRLERAEQVFRLELDGRRVAEGVASGAAGMVGSVVFALTAPAAGRLRGQVLKQSDRLPVDDSRPFVLTVWDQVSVLLVHGADRGSAGRGGWRHLAEALAPDGAQDSLFDVHVVASEQLTTGDLVAADVAVFVDPDPLGRQLLGGLLGWLADGGGAVFLVGDQTLGAYLEGTLLPVLGLPAEASFRRRFDTHLENVRLLAANHPVFRRLGAESLATLADLRWRRYFALAEGECQVLLAFSSDAPALLEGKYGQGVYILMPFNLHLDSSNLPLSPMFLPLAQRLLAYLAQRQVGVGEATVLVGQRPQVSLGGSRGTRGNLDDVATLRVHGPGAPAMTAQVDLTWRRGVPSLIAPAVHRQGFYTFTAGGDTVGLIAAVTPTSEGDPRLGTPVELRELLQAAGLESSHDLGQVASADFGATMTGHGVAAWLFGLAFLLLCLELYLARGTDRLRLAA